MPHDDRSTGRPADDLHSVSYVTGGSFSAAELESYSCDTTQIDLSEAMVSPVLSSPAIRESPDDLFASEYRMVLGDRPSRSMRTIEDLQGMVHGVMMAGERYSFSASQDGDRGVLELRTCSRYMREDRKLVGWMSYRDMASEVFVIPNLALLERYDEYPFGSEIQDADRYERFFAGEARVTLIAGMDEGAVDIFATRECEQELVEHFLLAIRGGPQASLVNYLWQRAIQRRLASQAENVAASTPYVAAEDMVTECVSHGEGFGDSFLDLQVRLRDTEDPRFIELFGKQALQCRMLFSSDDTTRWKGPRFEWR